MVKSVRFVKIKGLVCTTFVYLIPFAAAIITILPFVFILLISLQHTYHLSGNPRFWIPRCPSLDTYFFIFKNFQISRWLLNSIIVSFSVTCGGVIIFAAAGYVFYRYRDSKLISILFTLVLASIMIPKAATILPSFLIIKKMHLLNTYGGLILPPLGIPIGVFLMRQAMFSFPSDLIDAAKIDGCSEFQIFWRIVLPVLKPALALVGIYTFMEQWRDFLWPLIVTSVDEMKVLNVGLSTFATQFRTDYGVRMAGVMIAALPSLIVFLFLQGYIIKGLTVGALKE